MQSDEITYYGLDLSRITLVNAERMLIKEEIKQGYCPAWIARFDKKNTVLNLQKTLKVEHIIDVRYPFQNDQIIKRDIESRELLYVIECRGWADGMGLTKHWLHGINSAWGQYFLFEHSKMRRKILK